MSNDETTYYAIKCQWNAGLGWGLPHFWLLKHFWRLNASLRPNNCCNESLHDPCTRIREETDTDDHLIGLSPTPG